MEPVIRVGLKALRALQQESLRNLPAESCGLVLGVTQGVGRATRVSSIVCMRNQLRGRAASSGFRLDPVGVVRAERQALQAGLQVLGPWHSHPAGTALLSRRDRDAGGYPFQLLLPLPLVGPARVRVWGLEDATWREMGWLQEEDSGDWMADFLAGGPGLAGP